MGGFYSISSVLNGLRVCAKMLGSGHNSCRVDVELKICTESRRVLSSWLAPFVGFLLESSRRWGGPDFAARQVS